MYSFARTAHAPGAARLEHPLQIFTEFGSDRAISLHVCSLYTVARLDSGALYWWYVSTGQTIFRRFFFFFKEALFSILPIRFQ